MMTRGHLAHLLYRYRRSGKNYRREYDNTRD